MWPSTTSSDLEKKVKIEITGYSKDEVLEIIEKTKELKEGLA